MVDISLMIAYSFTTMMEPQHIIRPL